MSHAETEVALQRVIDAVAREYVGRPASEVKVALARGFTEIGHPAQSDPWLEAVAEETADGHRYIVGTATMDPSSPSSPTGSRAEDRPREGGQAMPREGSDEGRPEPGPGRRGGGQEGHVRSTEDPERSAPGE